MAMHGNSVENYYFKNCYQFYQIFESVFAHIPICPQLTVISQYSQHVGPNSEIYHDKS